MNKTSPDEHELSLTVLGTGDAFASKGRLYSSYLLERIHPELGDARAVLLDCGPTTLTMLQSMEFDFSLIDLVILTHHHWDHIGGIPGLFLDFQYRSIRDRPLVVVGPSDTENRCESFYQLGYTETYELKKRGYEVQYRELSEGSTEKILGLQIHSRKMVHQDHTLTLGYRFEWGGRSMGWSGDTEWNDAIVDLARDTDLFLTECFMTHNNLRFHTSLEDLVREAPRLDTKRILLTHMGETMLERVAEGNLPFEAAQDGQKVTF